MPDDLISMYRVLLKKRDTEERVCHIDLDYFFAQCEERRCPRLARVPFVVGSNAMVSTSNYVARRYGVKSGMPGFQAKERCPELVICTPDFRYYHFASNNFKRALLEHFSRNVYMAGLDEAYVDLTGYIPREREFRFGAYSGDCICFVPRLDELPESATIDSAEESTTCTFCKMSYVLHNVVCYFEETIEDHLKYMRLIIRFRTGLTCSIGYAPTRMLAKVCSDLNKPNGQFVLMPKDVDNFIRNTSLSRFPFVGPTFVKQLSDMDIVTGGDLLSQAKIVSRTVTGARLKYLAHILAGVDEPAPEKETERTRGVEITFPRVAFSDLWNLHGRSVAMDAIHSTRKLGVFAVGVISVKIQTFAFRNHTKTKSLKDKVKLSEAAVIPIVQKLVNEYITEMGGKTEIRLFGVRFSNLGFTASKVQQQLTFQPASAKRAKLTPGEVIVIDDD